MAPRTALDGVGRAELAAGVAPDAVFLVDVDDPAQFTLAEVADVGRTLFPVGVGAREEGVDRDRILGHGCLSRDGMAQRPPPVRAKAGEPRRPELRTGGEWTFAGVAEGLGTPFIF